MGLGWPAWLGGEDTQPDDSSGVPRARILEVRDARQLESLIGHAGPEPVVLYLHDPWCPVSSHAIGEVERVDSEVHVVDVSRQSDLSRVIEAATGIRHESPQLIVLRDGEPLWHASHWRIKRRAIEEALTFERRAE